MADSSARKGDEHLRVTFDLKTGEKSQGREATADGVPDDIFSYLGGLSSVIPYVSRASHWRVHPEGQTDARFHAPYHELYLIDQGTGQYEVNGEVMDLAAGDIFFLKPHDVHRYLEGSKYSYFSVHFTFTHTTESAVGVSSEAFGEEFFHFLSEVYPSTTKLHLVRNGPVRAALERLTATIRKSGVGSKVLAGLLLVEAFVHIVRSILFSREPLAGLGDNQLRRRDELMVHQIMEGGYPLRWPKLFLENGKRNAITRRR